MAASLPSCASSQPLIASPLVSAGMSRPWSRRQATKRASLSAVPSPASAGMVMAAATNVAARVAANRFMLRIQRAPLMAPGSGHEHPWKMRPRGARARETCAVATVLLVEDDPDIVGLLTDFFAVEGFSVLATGGETLPALGGVDAVVLDVMLPGA